jgi:cellulose synthase/poly-beta-1,6-N-acetylglucosamine synthase-like glycosyltransferase
MYGRDALEILISNFADPAVGYVTGRMCYVSQDESGVAGSCGAYMRYENALRALETRCGSIVGVDGGIDAIRKELYVEMAPDMLPDLVLPLSVVEKGYRVVYEPKAIVKEDALSSPQAEFRMRTRVILRSLHAMWHKRQMFNPLKHGFFSLALFSHKLLRYCVPFVLIGLAVLSALMIGQGAFWNLAFGGQCVFYGTAALGYFLLRRRRNLPLAVYFPFYFVLINLAALVAWTKFIRKKKQTLWVPRTG